MKVRVSAYSRNIYLFYAGFLAVLFIFINYGANGRNPYQANDYRWYLITFGLIIFLLSMLPTLKLSKISKSNMFLMLYVLIASVQSVFSGDIKHVYEVLKLALPLWFIFQTRLFLRIDFLNALYLLALFGAIVLYDPAYSDYGFLPGQTKVNLHQGLWWRVSIWNFKTAPFSAAFSILVFFTNIFLNKRKSKYFILCIAVYFIVLSGSRTGYFVFLTGLALLFIYRYVHFRFNSFYTIIPIFMLFLIFFMQIFAELLALLNLQNELVSNAILRSNDSSDTSNLSSRILIMTEHFRLWRESVRLPILGIGSDVYRSPLWSGNGGALGGSSDSFITHMLVRDGIAFFCLVGVYINQFITAMKEQDKLRYLLLVFTVLFCVGYGAWLNFTNPVFVLLCGFLFSYSKEAKHTV